MVRNARGRITDTEMAEAVPPEHWKICTGPAQTVILCDTSAFHKGLKPTNGHRILLEFHYTSGKPAHSRTFLLNGLDRPSNLNAIQKQALIL
jgi:hypothetical protein